MSTYCGPGCVTGHLRYTREQSTRSSLPSWDERLQWRRQKKRKRQVSEVLRVLQDGSAELQSRVRGLAEALVSRGGVGAMDRLWFLIEGHTGGP